jgi:periplasmic copper chaperone A
MTSKSMFAAALLLLAPGAASAETFRAGTIEIIDPWIPAPPTGAEVAGGYMTIRNTGSVTDRLVDAATDAAKEVHVHAMTMKDNVMQMRPVEGGLEIKPGATVTLSPGSFHLMLIGLGHSLKQGERVKGTLQFEKGGKVEVDYAVEPLGSSGPSAAHRTPHDMHMPGMEH